MSFKVADAALAEPAQALGPSSPTAVADIPANGERFLVAHDHAGNAARGIAIAILLALPVWCLIAVIVYLLI